MKIKNQHLEKTLEALMEMSPNKMPGAVAMHVVRVKRAVAGAFADFMDAQTLLITQHGGTKEEGLTTKDAGWEEFHPEWMVLLAIETEVEAEPFTEEELFSNGAEYSPDALGLLDHIGLLVQ